MAQRFRRAVNLSAGCCIAVACLAPWSAAAQAQAVVAPVDCSGAVGAPALPCLPPSGVAAPQVKQRWFDVWPVGEQQDGPAEMQHLRMGRDENRIESINGHGCRKNPDGSSYKVAVIRMQSGQIDRPQAARTVCLGALARSGDAVRLITAAHCAPDGGRSAQWQLKFRCADPDLTLDASCRSASGTRDEGLPCTGQYGAAGDTGDACRRDIAVCEVKDLNQCKLLPAIYEAQTQYTTQPSSSGTVIISTNDFCAKSDVVDSFDHWPSPTDPDPRSPIQLGLIKPLLTNGDSGGPLLHGNRLLGVAVETLNRPFAIPVWVLDECAWKSPMAADCPP